LVAASCGAAVWIEGRCHIDFDPLLPIECKRLPTPRGKDSDEREYVRATNALECVLQDITGEKNMTLGDYLKHHPGLFPGHLKKCLEGLWGYAATKVHGTVKKASNRRAKRRNSS